MKRKMVKHLSTFIAAVMLVGAVPAYALAEEKQIVSEKQAAEQVVVHFVNSTDTTKLSAMAAYISNATSYVKDGVSYLRMDVQQVYDVKITVEGKEGVKVEEYVQTVQGRGGLQEVTFFTLDYAIKDAAANIEAQASYLVPGVFTETQVQDLIVVIGNDVEAAKAELAATIEAAKAIEAPSAAITAALETAEKANSYLTKKVTLEAALKALKTALAENPTAAEVYFVNESDPSKQSALAAYMANPKTYAKDGVNYLRLDVQQVYDVKVLIEGKEGSKVSEYVTTVVGRGGPEEVTMFTYDYVLSNAAVLKGSASYFVPNVFTEPQSHELQIVIGKNVDAAKANLEKALKVASSIEDPAAALISAIQQATAANSYLKSNEEIITATKLLVQEIAKQVSFSDVNEHWAKASISEAVASGVAEGYVDGSFKPNQQVTRAEFTKLIASALHLPAATGHQLTFSDAASIQAWALPYVQQSVKAGIISGYEDGTFKANNNISRSEMAVMVVKALNLELEAADTLAFTDNDSIAEYAKPYVATAVKHGLIDGLTNGAFGGKETATRAQAVTIILRAAN